MDNVWEAIDVILAWVNPITRRLLSHRRIMQITETGYQAGYCVLGTSKLRRVNIQP